MAKIEDALPNETVTDEAFVEQEVTVPEDSVPTQEGQANVTMDEEGGAEINFDPNAMEGLQTEDHFSNLAEVMDEQYLDELGANLFDKYTEYKQSRGDWEDTYREGLELLGFKYEKRTQPFRGASGVTASARTGWFTPLAPLKGCVLFSYLKPKSSKPSL